MSCSPAKLVSGAASKNINRVESLFLMETSRDRLALTLPMMMGCLVYGGQQLCREKWLRREHSVIKWDHLRRKTRRLYCHCIRFTLTAVNFLPPWNDLLLFCTAALVLLIIPGPAVLYVVARSLDQGRRAGLASACGIASGGLVHVLAATLGLSALLVSSAAAYAVVKYTGAAYLFYLGIRKFRERLAAPSEVVHVEPLPLRRVYAQGVVVNVLNPKTAIFFFAFLPQFVNPARGHVSAQFFALGMVFTVMGLSSDSGWALTAGSAAGWLRRNHKFMRNQHYVTGTVYLGLGMATAVTGSRHK